MSFHRDLTLDDVHSFVAAEYASTAARDADTDWNGDSTNVGKFVRITTDPEEYYLLIDTTGPTFYKFLTDVDTNTIYTIDGTINEDRTIEVTNTFKLLERAYDLAALTFTEAYTFNVGNGSIYLEAAEGDGAGNYGNVSRIGIDQSTMEVLDQINSKGLVYAADYSTAGELLDRWIPDKAWVEAHTGGGSIYTTDGSITGDRVVTGDGTNRIAFVTFDDFDVVVDDEIDLTSTDGTNIGQVFANPETVQLKYSNGVNSVDFRIDQLSSVFIDNVRGEGITYNADYSSGYTDRSLVDKEYADAAFESQDHTITANRTITANNDLTFEINQYDLTASNYTERRIMSLSTDGALLSYVDGDGLGGIDGSRSITVDAAGVEIVDDLTTTGEVLRIESDSLTSGQLLSLYSNSADTSVRALAEIIQDNPLAVFATPLFVRQDAEYYAAELRSAHSRSLLLQSTNNSIFESGLVISNNQVSGTAIWDIYSDFASDGETADFYINFEPVSGGSLTAMKISPATANAGVITIGTGTDVVVVDYGQDVSIQYSDRSLVDKGYADGISLYESDNTLAAARTVTSTQTTSDGLTLQTSTQTTGALAYFLSTASNTSTREIVSIRNDSGLAAGAIPLYIHQGADNLGAYIEGEGSRQLEVHSLQTSGDLEGGIQISWNDGVNKPYWDLYGDFVSGGATSNFIHRYVNSSGQATKFLDFDVVTANSGVITIGDGTDVILLDYGQDVSIQYTDRSLVDKAYADSTGTYRVHMPCEDNSSMSTSNSFSWGNGATNGSARIYVPTGYDCEIEALTFKSPNAATATLGIRKNGGNFLTGAAMSGAFSQTDTWTSSNAVADGDAIDVRPTAHTSSGAENVCVVVLKFTPQ